MASYAQSLEQQTLSHTRSSAPYRKPHYNPWTDFSTSSGLVFKNVSGHAAGRVLRDEEILAARKMRDLQQSFAGVNDLMMTGQSPLVEFMSDLFKKLTQAPRLGQSGPSLSLI